LAKVLVVDDSQFMRTMLRNMLVSGGHTVVAEGKNGREAVRLFQLYNPDVVTMDITMPDMDGIQAVQAIRAMNQQACVVMVSAIGQESIITEALNAGAQGFIVKPFRTEQVLHEVEGAVVRCTQNDL